MDQKKLESVALINELTNDNVTESYDSASKADEYLIDTTHATLENDMNNDSSSESYIFSDDDCDRQLLEAVKAAEKLLDN